MTNEDFPPAAADEPIPPDDANLDTRSQPIYDEPDEDVGVEDAPHTDAGDGKAES
jgi:hypothetical protein